MLAAGLLILTLNLALAYLIWTMGIQFGVRSAEMSTFECGIDVWGLGSSNFAARFVSMGLIFLIFEVELMALVPLLNQATGENPPGFRRVLLLSGFTFFVVWGLWLEIAFGGIEWQ